jgi:two-component system, NtrC family, sensor histidine kinase HydH
MMVPSSESLYERLFEFGPSAVVVVNSGGRLALANRQAESVFGYARGELVGRPVEVLAPERFRTAYTELLDCGGSRFDTPSLLHTRNLAGLRKDGSEFPVEITLCPAEAAEGTLVLAFRDLSEQKQAHQELQARARQQAAVSELGRRALTGIDLPLLMAEAAALVRAHLEVEYANVLELLPDGRVMFQAGAGWEEGLVGRATYEVAGAIPATQVLLSQTPVIVDDFRTDERFADASLLREHGVVSSLNVPLYGHDRPFGVLGAHSTQRRPFPSEDVAFLQSVANVLSAALEREWYEQRQRERYLQRAEQMMALGQVAAGVAHELRNPLTAVKGLIQVNLRQAAAGGLPPEDLAVIEHEIRRMERTLQTFLDFARPPQPDRRRLSPADVVDRVFAVVKGRAKKQQVSLRLLQPDTPVGVEADHDQLQQLLLNLVLNALDAMPGGGTLGIDLRAPRDGHVEIYVRDTGPGIAPHILPKVFETFVSSKETGIGLGLPVSKRIAEEHGGSLSAYNLPGGGACFLLRLPAPASQ